MLTILAILLSSQPDLFIAPPIAQAQISNNQPGQAYASVVDCIRSGSNRNKKPEDSPRFATTCFSSAWYKNSYNDPIIDPTWDAAYTDGAVYAFGDGKPETFSPPEPGHSAVASLGDGGSPGGGVGVGAVYGLAYEGGTNPASAHFQQPRIYAAAYAKRITRFGSGGPGAIYLLDRSNDNETLFVQVPGVVPGPAGVPGNPGDGSMATFPNGTTAASYTPSMGGLHTQQHDNTLIHWASRAGLGDIELDAQGRYLYGVNIWQRTVFRFDTWAVNPQGSYTTLPQAPQQAAAGACNTSGRSGPQDLRPFALKVTSNAIFLGATCTAESSQDRQDVRAVVLRYQFATNAWDATSLLSFPLAAYDAQRYETATWDEPWQPWWNGGAAYPNVNTFVTPYAQPMFGSSKCSDLSPYQSIVYLRHVYT